MGGSSIPRLGDRARAGDAAGGGPPETKSAASKREPPILKAGALLPSAYLLDVAAASGCAVDGLPEAELSGVHKGGFSKGGVEQFICFPCAIVIQ